MNPTKKSLMIAGGIIAIVVSVLLILTSLVMFLASTMITTTMVEEIFVESGQLYTTADVDLVVRVAKFICTSLGIYFLVVPIVNIIFGSKVIQQSGTYSNKKSNIIVLLVFSLLSGNILTAGFMIASLCLKFNPQKAVEEQAQNSTNSTITIE